MQALLDRATNRLGIWLVYVIIGLAITGGFIFRGEHFRFEISQLNIFAVALALVALLRYFLNGPRKEFEQLLKKIIVWGQTRAPQKVLIATLLLGFVAFLAHVIRHYTFETTFYDMSFMNPPFFSTFKPKLFYCSVCRNESLLSEHIMLSLIPVAAFFQLFKSDVILILFKTLCMFVPVYYFLKKGPLSKKPTLIFWALTLLVLSTPFKSNFTWDFCEDHFAFALILLSLLALYKGKAWLSGFLIVMVALTKENLPFTTLLMSVPILFSPDIPLTKKQRLWLNGFVIVFSLVYAILVYKVLIPHFMEGSEARNNILKRFPGMGNTMSEFIGNFLHQPIHFIYTFLSRLSLTDTIQYIVFVLLPFALGYRAWIWTAPAWPQFLGNLLVDHPQQRMMVNHYEMVILPFLFAALVFGMANREFNEKRILPALILALCVAGRGPLINVTRLLAYKGYLIPAAIELNSWKNIEEPLAADAFTLPHFNGLEQTRILEFHQKPLPIQDKAELKYFVEANAKKSISDQARDISDAKTFLVNLTLLGGPWFADELRRQGAEQVAVARDLWGKEAILLFRVKRSPLEVVCERDGFCQKPYIERN